MGAWGTGILQNDTTADIWVEFKELYNKGLSLKEIRLKLEKEYKPQSNTEYYGEIDSTDDGTILELPDPSDPAEKARMLIYAQQYFRKSYNLAELVEKEFLSTGRVSRGVKQRNDEGIWVLQATAMPSILVETGYITNRSEEDYLNSKEGQQELAECIARAIKRYKDQLENSKPANGNGNAAKEEEKKVLEVEMPPPIPDAETAPMAEVKNEEKSR
jgi:N-acetylmuramoyl-L-alanine amidase